MSKKARILALEPYAALSHRLFLEGLQCSSSHNIEIHSLPPRKWKWRMRSASLYYRDLLCEHDSWDALLVSDFVNWAELKALLPEHLRQRPCLMYFHENQLTYPLQENEKRDDHYTMTHLHAMLAADHTAFNSDYHRLSLLEALASFVKRIPDMKLGSLIDELKLKCSTLPLGTHLECGEIKAPSLKPKILWSHRWEYDKDPALFVDTLIALDKAGEEFELMVLGESFRKQPPEYDRLKSSLGHRLHHLGFIERREDYLEAVASADIVFSTALHEFFGLSTLEALRLGLYPVLPDDLAYPELLGFAAKEIDKQASDRALFMYRRKEGPLQLLKEVLSSVREGGHLTQRQALMESTQRYYWPSLIKKYDEMFDQLVAK